MPMQGTQVQSLVQKDPTCCRILNPCMTATEPTLPSVHASQEKPPQWEAPAPQQERLPSLPGLEKAHVQQQNSAAKN